MPSPQETDFAHQVVRLAHRSLCAAVGLRHGLLESDRHDLVALLDLIEQDAQQALRRGKQVIADRRQARRLRILSGLGRLSTLGGPRAARVARGLAEDLSSPSGAFPAYRSGGM